MFKQKLGGFTLAESVAVLFIISLLTLLVGVWELNQSPARQTKQFTVSFEQRWRKLLADCTHQAQNGEFIATESGITFNSPKQTKRLSYPKHISLTSKPLKLKISPYYGQTKGGTVVLKDNTSNKKLRFIIQIGGGQYRYEEV